MKNSIDKRFITDEFLLRHFAPKDKDSETIREILRKSRLQIAQDDYTKLKKGIDQVLQKSGQPKLTDYEAGVIIERYNRFRTNN